MKYNFKLTAQWLRGKTTDNVMLSEPDFALQFPTLKYIL